MSAKKTAKPTVPKSEPAGENRTIDLLKKIHSDRIDPKSIAIADRRQLVAHLMESGYSTADMAQILQVSDRSIERDKKAIRASNSLARDPQLVEQMVGRLLGEAELAVQRIRKVTREKTTLEAVKIDGEHRCYQIISDLIQRFQSLGYLPTAAQKLQADVMHHANEIPEFDLITAEVERLKTIVSPDQPQEVAQIEQLESKVVRASLSVEAESLSKSMEGDVS